VGATKPPEPILVELLDFAPGAPGIDPRWTSSAKSGVGTALSKASPVWFTLSHGVLNEVYYPRVDTACLRDCELLVTGSNGYFSEEKRDCRSDTTQIEAGVPAFRIVNTSTDGRYRIEKDIVTDPKRPCVLQRVRFIPAEGAASDYHVHVLVAPHLVNAGRMNSAWIAEYNDVPFLMASGRGRYLAVACSMPWRARSAGYVGESDGYQQLLHASVLDPQYQRADDGNVALTGEIDVAATGEAVVLALGFGQSEIDAANAARASLEEGFDAAQTGFIAAWRHWQAGLKPLDRPQPRNSYRVSTSVLASHRAIDRAGAVVASLSIPWGASKGDDDLGGYHLVWPRDLVESAGAFLAAGDAREALSILEYLREVQLASGRWAQNLWLDGRPYWRGMQMDECALPILLADLLHRHGHLQGGALDRFVPMLRKAAGYVLSNGPSTGQDRWEEDSGFSPFTLAVEISALLAAADLLENHDAAGAAHLRETADCWNEQIEAWTLAADPEICAAAGVKSYYVRIAANAATDVAVAIEGDTQIRNQVESKGVLPARDVLSPDALALVRFGLRAPDDPRILDTIRAIDHSLRVEMPQGPLWYRYTGDGYGEHADGSPFDGVGQGRLWPLLTGERAHYELAAGHRAEAEALLATLEGSASAEGLLPEQTWDGPDMPDRELSPGRPSGSAMPLAWAHAEHIKLLRSLADGAVFDMPPQPVARYIKARQGSGIRIWRPNNQLSSLPPGKRLRCELPARARIHWTLDGWRSATDTSTIDTPFGTHFADLDIATCNPGTLIEFTFYWHDQERWEDSNYTVSVGSQAR